ncbi:MAG: cysteine hydrolase family protein [Bordetella sp.]|uniref:cysteine hydrolase family protein n=1 Tax=Bordetella genomosp. 1 TaxID=1395607 RepID=UPI00211B06BE|nr:cysteine hydrolase family protein [Bordetella genomosp. 1]MDQ8031551.1 cysteine hydrolase family protein [Bordetella sp.]
MSAPITEKRPPDTAVLALHYQNDVLHPDGRIRLGVAGDDLLRGRLVRAAWDLLSGARALDLVVVHVRVAFQPDYTDLVQNCTIFRNVAASGAVIDGEWGSDFYDGLAPDPQRAREHAVRHTRISAFYDTPLEDILRGHGVRRLVVGGVATHSVVEGTVRHASDMGYEVMVAEDACATADPAAHAAALSSMKLIAGIGTVARALQWAAEPAHAPHTKEPA